MITSKNNLNYQISEGLSDEDFAQIIVFAKTDSIVAEQTSDAHRFENKETAQSWLQKNNKKFYTLHKTNDHILAGIIWFEPLTIPDQFINDYPDCRWTFAIRIYKNARGEGLSIPFMKTCFADFWQKNPNKTVWLSTRINNSIPQHIYEKFGFKQIGINQERTFFAISPK